MTFETLGATQADYDAKAARGLAVIDSLATAGEAGIIIRQQYLAAKAIAENSSDSVKAAKARLRMQELIRQGQELQRRLRAGSAASINEKITSVGTVLATAGAVGVLLYSLAN